MNRLLKPALLALCVMLVTALSPPAWAATEATLTAPAQIYAVNSAAHTYHTIPAADYAKIQAALNLPAAKEKADETAKNSGGFCIFDKNGGKALYAITEKRLLRNGQPLAASEAQRKKLLTLCKGYWKNPAIPELLGYMSTEKITAVSFSGMALGPQPVEGIRWISLKARSADEPDLVERFAAILRTLEVDPAKTEEGHWGPSNLGTDEMNVELTFSTGVTYQMRLWDADFFIGTSDDPIVDRVYRYTFAPSGMANPRGWYLRADMEELAKENSWLQDAIIVKSPEHSPAYTRLTKDTESGGTALRQLSAFKERFVNPGPGEAPPPWGSDKAGYDSAVCFYLREYDGTYTEYRLWSDEKGGMAVYDKKRTLYPLRPGDCAFVLSLMEAGQPMTAAQAAALTGLAPQ